MTIYSDSELFLGGMVTGAVLCLAIVLAFVLRPMRPRRRRGGDCGFRIADCGLGEPSGRGEGEVRRFERGLIDREVMKIERRGRGWRGTTRRVAFDDGRGAA